MTDARRAQDRAGASARDTWSDTRVAPAAVAASSSAFTAAVTASIDPVTELPKGPMTGSKPGGSHRVEAGGHVWPRRALHERLDGELGDDGHRDVHDRSSLSPAPARG